jgi:hypothetical protein
MVLINNLKLNEYEIKITMLWLESKEYKLNEFINLEFEENNEKINYVIVENILIGLPNDFLLKPIKKEIKKVPYIYRDFNWFAMPYYDDLE